MANIFNAAKYILEKNGDMSTMKLQKLCYYAQAWSLVWDDEPLFPENFEAWANGPVCRELFHFHQGKFKVGASDIPDDVCADPLTEEQTQTIDAVLEYYGDKNAQWLSTLTHMEDPWKIAREGVPGGAKCSNVISLESMAMYYGGL